MAEMSAIVSHREAGVSDDKCDTHTPIALVAPPLKGASRPKALAGLSQVLPALESDKKNQTQSASFKSQCNW